MFANPLLLWQYLHFPPIGTPWPTIYRCICMCAYEEHYMPGCLSGKSQLMPNECNWVLLADVFGWPENKTKTLN